MTRKDSKKKRDELLKSALSLKQIDERDSVESYDHIEDALDKFAKEQNN